MDPTSPAETTNALAEWQRVVRARRDVADRRQYRAWRRMSREAEHDLQRRLLDRLMKIFSEPMRCGCRHPHTRTIEVAGFGL